MDLFYTSTHVLPRTEFSQVTRSVANALTHYLLPTGRVKYVFIV